MSATVILGPAAAAEAVCHEEQLRIWADDVIEALAMGDFIRFVTYDDKIEMQQIVMREIKSIVEGAFDHPEAKTIRRK